MLFEFNLGTYHLNFQLISKYRNETVRHILYSLIFTFLSCSTLSIPCPVSLWENVSVWIAEDKNLRVMNPYDCLENYSLFEANFHQVKLHTQHLFLVYFLRVYLGNVVSVWPDSLKKLTGEVSMKDWLHAWSSKGLQHHCATLVTWSHIHDQASEQEVLVVIVLGGLPPSLIPPPFPFLSVT